MKQRIASFTLSIGFAAMTAAPATAQMWNFPDYMVPGMRDAPTSWVAGGLGRGVNDDTGENNAFGAVFGMTGAQVNFMVGAGLVTGGGSDELTLGGAVGGDIMESDGLTLGVQGGIGWISPGDFTIIRVPVGLSVRTESEMDGGGVVVPWAMPRLNLTRFSGGGESDSELDLGISGGVSVTLPSGFGFHGALDWLMADGGDPIYLGLGVHYILGSSGN